jgi:RNA polymerase sigma factor (sigma-70 family)
MLPADSPAEIMRSGETDALARDMQRLVPAAAGGCQDAWNQIVERYAGRVWAVARAHRLSAADAADVSQTTWLRLLEHLPRLTAPERVGAWLATTARRECLRVIRRSGREWPHDELPDVPAPAADLVHELVTAERDAALWQAFARLRARDQALLRLLAQDPAPGYAEISQALEMPIGSIGPTRVRALDRLRREIAALGPLAHALG